MPAAIFTIDFEQGIPRDVIVDQWRDETGKLYSLDGCRAHMQLFTRDTDTAPAVDLSTDNAGIEIINGQMYAHFTIAHTSAMKPLNGAIPIAPVIECAKRYRAGVFEWRVWNKDGVPFPLARGEYTITPSLLREVAQ